MTFVVIWRYINKLNWNWIDCLHRLCRLSRQREQNPLLLATRQNGWDSNAGARRGGWTPWRAVEEVLSFLQYLGDKGLSHATVEVYAAAVSSSWGVGQQTCLRPTPHEAFHARSQETLASEACLHSSVGTAGVARGLVSDPCEPLECYSLKVWSFKTALLLALTSSEWVSCAPCRFTLAVCCLVSASLPDYRICICKFQWATVCLWLAKSITHGVQ